MEFSELNLHPDLLKGIAEAGYLTCMPVQEQVLKHAFNGQDLYVQSQTGTGKTAAFLIVIYQRLLSEAMLNGKKAIIMVPTRELAVQVEEEAKIIGKYLPFKTGSFFGGVSYTNQKAMLKKNTEIMIGTPGRVLDLNQSGQMNLMDIVFLVIDEADRMFDMGFYPDLRKLIRAVPPADRRQTMLFSATLNSWVKNLAWEYTHNPFEIAIEPETVTVNDAEQILYHVSSQDKMKLLLGILKRENPESALVFCNTKRYAEIVSKRLRHNGYDCEFIMGDLPQPKRLKIIDDIKAGKLRLLVATDVAARGLDIEGLSLVVNYDLPNEAENYVHRIGRTARMGRKGKAFTLASEQDVYQLPAIERYIGQKIPSENASADLLTEDNSEGRHIRTDFYENREPRAKDRSRGRRKPGEKRLERPADSNQQGADQQSINQQGANQQGANRRREKPKAEPQKNKHARGARQEVSLSELSLEERMAYYRQKYDKSDVPAPRKTGGSEKAHNRKDKQAEKANANKAGAKNAGPGKNGAGNVTTDNTATKKPGRSNAPGKNRSDKRRNRRPDADKPNAAGPNASASVPENASGNTPAANALNTPAAAPAKKGILSKLLGVFRKKK